MNRFLSRYDSAFSAPVSYGIWTALAITGGQLYLDEFKNMSSLNLGMYFLGVVIVVGGVSLFTRRIAAGGMTIECCGYLLSSSL